MTAGAVLSSDPRGPGQALDQALGHDGSLSTDNALLDHLARLVDNQLAA